MAGTGETYEIISSPLNEITSSLYDVTPALTSVERAFNRAFNPINIQIMKPEIVLYQTQIEELELKFKGVTREIEAMQEQTEEVADKGNLLGKAYEFASRMINVDKIKQMVSESDKLVQTTAKFDTMNDGLQSTQQLMDMVYASAQDARGAYTDMSTVVASLGNNAQGAFGSSSEIVSFANLMQKQMSIAGAPQAVSTNALLSLSQSMGNGIMEADSLNAIFAQAPNLIQNIADYLNVPNEKVKELANSGQISAEMFKNAIFAASGEINSEFEQMPMTWEQIWGSMQNVALKKLQPVFQKINDIANSEALKKLLNGVTNIFGFISNIVVDTFDAIALVGTMVYDNWSFIAPVVAGALGIMLMYWGATKGVAIAQGILTGAITAFHGVQTFVSIGWGVLTKNTAAASAAMFVYNNMLLASPIWWIIIAIIMLIATIYLVIAAINAVTGSTKSAMGVILGIIAWVGALIMNIVIAVLNGIIQFLWTGFVEPFLGIIEWILNAVNGGFDSLGGAVANLIGQIISWFLSLGKIVTKIIDAICGTDWTSELESLQGRVLVWGKNEESITISRDAPTIDSRISYDDAWDAGYSLGKGLEDKISGVFSLLDLDSVFAGIGADSLSDTLTNISDNTSNISGDTAAISDGVNVSNENLKYLRDLAEQEAVNRFTTAEIKVDMTNNNNIASGVDLDGIISSLSGGLLEAMAVTAEGVHV